MVTFLHNKNSHIANEYTLEPNSRRYFLHGDYKLKIENIGNKEKYI